MKDNKEAMAEQITTLVGKPITQSREEIDHAIHKSNVFVDLSNEAFKEDIL